MNAVIIGFLLLINSFAILLNIKMTTGMETPKRVTLIIIEEIGLFVMMSIIYALCKANIEIKNQASRIFQVCTFTGINMIIMAGPINKLIAKHESHDMKGSECSNKIRLRLLISVAILAIEYLYIKSLIRI